MLAVRPPEHRPHRLPKGLRRFDWELFLIGWCALFHLFIAFTLAVAPFDQINTTASAPILAMGSRYLWAALFGVGGFLALLVTRRPKAGAQLFAAALVIFPIGAAWLATFALAVAEGRGSALSVVIWPFLEVPWAVAVVRVGLGKR